MRPLTPERLLEVWERCQGHGATVRALALLAAASPEASWDELGSLPLGERDRRLFQLREEALGARLDGLARCPGCGEPLDVALDGRELRSGGDAGPPAEFELAQDGLELRFRLPNSFDLLAVELCPAVEEARRQLAELCLLEARLNGDPVAAGDLSEDDLAALGEGMAEADPGAELLLELRCPACGEGWWELLDVATFFWAELEVQARQLLRQVHVLARAYGWHEADVLALSPWRRGIYLEMAGA
jgi:hypothetical protein